MEEEKKQNKKKTAIHESTGLLIGILISGLIFGILGYYLGRVQGTSSFQVETPFTDIMDDGSIPAPPVPPEPTESVSPTSGDLPSVPTVAPGL